MGKVIMTVDGNTAAAYTAYAFTQAAAIYPITPSSAMAETVDNWAAQGRKNIFDETADVVEMQSEAGAAGAMHGILQSGTLASTFTASQGLLLMQPTLYKMAGELLPGVLHVSARALAAQALSIFGDHQDVCAVRQTGCVMLASSSVQEVCDLAAVAHLSAIKGRLPFIHFFDGFRTSHEIQRIEALSYEDYEEMLDKEAVQAFRERALSPNHPVMRGTAQNPDIYFQTREAANLFYEKIPGIIKEYMAQIEKRIGRTYRFFQYYGAKNPKYVVIAMGSVCETIREILPQMNCADTDCDTGSSGMQDDITKDNIGIYGMIQVHLFRPFSAEDFLKELPESVERIAVLDRTKEPGALGEPLYLDICGALYGKENAPLVIGGRYGLGSKDTTPAQIAAVFDNLTDVQPKNHFTIGIEDDVTHHSLAVHPDFPIQTPAGLMQCKFWGLGSDGTVGANKQAVKIIGEYAKPYVQGYFSYDSKKSGGLTVSHLRFGDTPIRSEYLIQEADYIACHNESFLNSGYDLTEGLKENGIFVLNTQYGAEQIGGKLPKEMVHALIEKNARLYLIDAGKLAHGLGLGNRINMIMQGTFFHLTGILPQEKALACLKNSIQAAYGKKGADIVEKNIKAAEYGFRETKRSQYYEEIYSVVEERWLDVHKTEIDWVDGRKVAMCTLYDITEKKIYQKEIENQANNDFLTGLFNRMRCEQDLGQFIRKTREKDATGALLYMGLDDFKHINDGLGHQYGDILLKAISHSLRRIDGIENTCYRMGGDEFVVIIPDSVYPELERIVREVTSIFKKPWFLKGEDYYCTISMGIVYFPKDGETVEELVRKADIALLSAKRRGKNRVEYYDGMDASSSYRRLDLEKNMRTAAMNACTEFEVFYQPIIDVCQPGEPCCGAEALIRWNSSALGFVNPADFIPLAEYLGLINPIGEYVMKNAALRCKYWNDMGHPEYHVNVNLSVVQLLQNDIVKKVAKVLEETRIIPQNLTLEVTESLAINDMVRMKKILSEIRNLGVRVALDDFGTGYSSLNHIREMPLDVIKIDRCFIEHLGEDDFSNAFVRMVSELANAINVRVCVEGVETKRQRDIVKKMGIRMIQGFFYGKPMKIEEFEKKYLI